MYARRLTVAVTTDGSGDATAHSEEVDFGLLSQIAYEKGDFADGVDFVITVEETGEGLWTESNVNASTSRAPRQATHGVNGAAALYAAGGTGVLDMIAIVKSKVKIVIAQGGAAKSGTFHLILV